VGVIRSIGFERLIRWGGGAIVLLLIHGVGTPAAAKAGCNHLVTSQSDRQFDFNRLDDLIARPTDLLVDDDRQPAPRAPRPCSGPGCSSSVPWPASTASPSSAGPDQWVALGSVQTPAVASPPRRVPDEPAARPFGHKPSIFHPPPA
jgi:hypothetical protein